MLPIPRCLATLVHPRPPPQLLRLLGLPSLPKLAEIGRTTYPKANGGSARDAAACSPQATPGIQGYQGNANGH